jgi:hypothetical protein
MKKERKVRRGLIRLWLVSSLTWILGSSVVSVIKIREQIMREYPIFGDIIALSTEDVFAVSMIATVPPIAILLLGFAIGWVIDGFQNVDNENTKT